MTSADVALNVCCTLFGPHFCTETLKANACKHLFLNVHDLSHSHWVSFIARCGLSIDASQLRESPLNGHNLMTRADQPESRKKGCPALVCIHQKQEDYKQKLQFTKCERIKQIKLIEDKEARMKIQDFTETFAFSYFQCLSKADK